MSADKFPLEVEFCLKIGCSFWVYSFLIGQGSYLFAWGSSILSQTTTLIPHRPLYSLPLQCLKATFRESECQLGRTSGGIKEWAYWDRIPGGLVHTNTCVCSGPTRFSELLYLKRVGILNLLCPLTRVSGECRHINKKQTNLKYKSIVRECAKYIPRGEGNHFDEKWWV